MASGLSSTLEIVLQSNGLAGLRLRPMSTSYPTTPDEYGDLSSRQIEHSRCGMTMHPTFRLQPMEPSLKRGRGKLKSLFLLQSSHNSQSERMSTKKGRKSKIHTQGQW